MNHLVVGIDIAQLTHVARAEVVLVNLHLVKKNKENRDNTPSKSDKKDALAIADMVKNGYYSFIRNTTEAFEELRVFLSNRDFVVTRLVWICRQHE
ncbi:transposase [Paenibacillus phyllosphaerae]|uniref:Transposase n=1 Tax=Paenibacillus phyllosphaerae TaxID=274593 RepID=A0A7W5B0Z0_9BACL|nr:transposase [Paenibacillus phyllosphaerae]